MSFDLVLKNATLVDVQNGIHGRRDLGVADGKVAAVAEELSQGEHTVDLEGRVVLPGIIDMHVHVTQHLGGRVGYYMVAKTGVTTLIDFAGPISDITGCLGEIGCGLNVGCVDSILPDRYGQDPSLAQVGEFLDGSLAGGSLGVKILGGHFPLTPQASRHCIEEANRRRVMVAFHAGTTEQRSDILGMREAVTLCEGNRMVLAHINAYCRGKHYPYLEELRDAFIMLRENPGILSDSHLAVMNGTVGACADGKPLDAITVNCLRMFGRPETEEGLAQAIRDGLVRVIAALEQENVLLEREEALRHWREKETNTMVSFPANLSVVGAACALERVTPGGDFLIPMTATDGGGIPRNNLLGRLLGLYQLGYLSLEDIVLKASLNPARTFGLPGKGHLGVGADADITVVDRTLQGAERSYALGREIMNGGAVTGSGGCLLVTEAGVASAKKNNLQYAVADVAAGMLYAEK